MSDESKTFEQVVSDIPLPACPAVLIQIDHLIGRADFDFGELSALIRKDVALSAGLIKLSNSPVYSLRHNTSIPLALQMIGARNVAFYARAFLLQSSVANGSSTTRFWDSSWRVAEMSARLAKQLHKDKHDEVFTFGLFRDVGIAVLMTHYANYKAILNQANQDAEQVFTEHENREYGVNHAQVGAFIAADWHLPDYFVAAIHCHHDPASLQAMALPADAQQRAMEMIALAQIAEHAVQQRTGLSQTHEWVKLKDFCTNTLQLAEPALDELIAGCETA